MSIADRIKAKPHLFMPGQTVQGAVKQFNLYDTTPDEIRELMIQFNHINNHAMPKPGMRMLIPILQRHWSTALG
jgi:hypothetical protein